MVTFQCKNKTPCPNGGKSKLRVIWGKVTRIHGNSGALRAKFARSLPAYAMGRRIRIVSIGFSCDAKWCHVCVINKREEGILVIGNILVYDLLGYYLSIYLLSALALVLYCKIVI